MTILGFLTGNAPQRTIIGRDAEGAPGLTLDAAISISASREVSLTKNPVESGANIVDHATLGNITIEIEGMLSEAPLASSLAESALGALAGVAGGLIGTQVGGLASSLLTTGAAIGANAAVNFALSPDVISGESQEAQIANRIPGDADFPRKAYDYLLGLQENRKLLKLTTRRKSYTQLLMTRLSAPESIEIGKSLRFTATFEQVKIVNSASVTLPENVIDIASAPGAASKANLGKQAASEATSAQSGKLESTAFKLTFGEGGGLGSLFGG